MPGPMTGTLRKKWVSTFTSDTNRRIIMRGTRLFLTAALLVAAAGPLRADVILVVAAGDVSFNVIGGSMTGVAVGSPVTMSFTVDSNVFLNSASFPTRGYPIDLASFNMVVDGRPVPVENPQPGGATPYFVLRDNDPAVDGFFLSPGVDLPFPTVVTIPGLTAPHDLDFSVSYDNGNVLSSLDIQNALGTYDLTGIGSFLWTIGRFGNPGAEYNFGTLTISNVPEPTSLGLVAIGGALCAWVRRR